MNTQEVIHKLMTNFYSDMEAEICCCLAAGAPMDKLIITKPDLAIKGNTIEVIGSYGFDLSTKENNQ